MIKQYFSQYFLQVSDITFDMQENKMSVHTNGADARKVTLVDTGEKTMTGGRLKRVKDYIGKDTFCFTYGDGVSNVSCVLLHYKLVSNAYEISLQNKEAFTGTSKGYSDLMRLIEIMPERRIKAETAVEFHNGADLL